MGPPFKRRLRMPEPAVYCGRMNGQLGINMTNFCTFTEIQ